MYIRNDWHDSIFTKIYKSELYPTNTYHYSDIGFMLFIRSCGKSITKTTDSINCMKIIYIEPLGATTLGFNPLKDFEKKKLLLQKMIEYSENN